MRRLGDPPGLPPGPPWLTWWAAALLIVLSFGCAGVDSRAVRSAGPMLSGSATHAIVGVPFVPGVPGACGPAALASVLGYWGDVVTVEAIADAIGAPSLAGVLPLDLARYAAGRDPGLIVRTESGSLVWLRERVASDHPVVAFLDLGIGPVRQGHFVVVVGYDDDAGRVLLYSGHDSDASMPYRRFMAAWDRAAFWALTVERQQGGSGGPAAS